MSCCGNKRNAWIQEFQNNTIAGVEPVIHRHIVVEYLGKSVSKFRGPVSNKLYIFTHKGHRETIDSLDADVFSSSRKFRIVG